MKWQICAKRRVCKLFVCSYAIVYVSVIMWEAVRSAFISPPLSPSLSLSVSLSLSLLAHAAASQHDKSAGIRRTFLATLRSFLCLMLFHLGFLMWLIFVLLAFDLTCYWVQSCNTVILWIDSIRNINIM